MSRTASAHTTELRKLADQAAALAHQIRAIHTHLTEGDEPTRRAGHRLDHTAGTLQYAVHDLEATIADLTRITHHGSCHAHWGLCPDHGNTLTSSGNHTWCRDTTCRRWWNHDRTHQPCDQPATHQIRDTTGSELPLCTGHATDAHHRLAGAQLTPIHPHH